MIHTARLTLLLTLGCGLMLALPEEAHAKERTSAEQASARRKAPKDNEAKEASNAEKASARRKARQEQAAKEKEKDKKSADAALARRQRAQSQNQTPAAQEQPKKKNERTLKDLIRKTGRSLNNAQASQANQRPRSAPEKQNCTTKVVFGVSLKTCSGGSSGHTSAGAANSASATSAPKPPAPERNHSAANTDPQARPQGIERRPATAKDKDFWGPEAKPDAAAKARPQPAPIQATNANYEPSIAHDRVGPPKPTGATQSSIDRSTFGLQLGAPHELHHCDASLPRATTCIETANAKSLTKAPAATYPLGYSAMPVVLADNRCPPWLKSEGCRITLAVHEGKVAGTSLTTTSDPEQQKAIVEQLSEKYKRSPITTQTGSCRRLESGELVTNAPVHIWALEGMRAIYSPAPKDCARGNISVELESLQRARTDESSPKTNEPRM